MPRNKHIKTIFALAVSAVLFSCNAPQPAQKPIDQSRYSVFYRDQEDDKSVFSERVVLTKAMAKDTLTALLKERLTYVNDHFPQATRIFVYVYKTKADYDKDGFNWVGMLQKVDKDDGTINIKTDLNPASPPEKSEQIGL